MSDNYDEIEKSVHRGIVEDGETLRLVYIVRVGQESDGLNIYHLLYTANIDDVWNDDWPERPACNCSNLEPPVETVRYVKELKTHINFVLGQELCCHSYQDVCDRCVALAAESIDGYETYPEPLRLVLNYGDTMEDTDRVLAQRDLKTRFVNIY